jgi:hypothetical protein
MPEINEKGERILRCDFCGEASVSVRRVAIDTGYERLQTPHKELYACESCSVKKERARLGLDPS